MKPDKVKPELVVEYVYEPSQDAQERLDEAWDIIVDLIIKDFEDEKNAQEAQGWNHGGIMVCDTRRN